MRPTTKDIARTAGVSLATVDRVLNGRPGVRPKTVDAVNEAIKQLGFIRNLSAANLARGRVYRFQFLLPSQGDQFLGALIDRIVESRIALVPEHTDVHYRQVLESDPHQIARMVSEIDHDIVDGVAIMAPESPQLRDAALRLQERGVHVVRFISGQWSGLTEDFVGIDNRAAGATAGRLMGRFSAGRSGHILVVADTINARDGLERRFGFDRVIIRDYPGLVTLPSVETYGDEKRTREIIANAYQNFPDICGVYVLGSEARVPVRAIKAVVGDHEQVLIAHERTPYTEEMLKSGGIDAVIVQNPGHLVRSAIRLLRARCDDRGLFASQEQIRIEILLKENLG